MDRCMDSVILSRRVATNTRPPVQRRVFEHVLGPQCRSGLAPCYRWDACPEHRPRMDTTYLPAYLPRQAPEKARTGKGTHLSSGWPWLGTGLLEVLVCESCLLCKPQPQPHMKIGHRKDRIGFSSPNLTHLNATSWLSMVQEVQDRYTISRFHPMVQLSSQLDTIFPADGLTKGKLRY